MSRIPPSPRERRPRVLQVGQGPPARGGIPTFIETLVTDPVLGERFAMRFLNTTRKAEYRGGVLSPGNAARAVVDVARVFRLARRADVVHLHTALLPLLPLLRTVALCLAARASGAAVLCHVHSSRVNSGRREDFDPAGSVRWLLRGLAVCQAVLTVSEAGRRALEPHVGADVRKVDNAVDADAFVPADPGDEPARILFVGTLCIRKGLLDLAAALELLADRGVRGWTLEIVGGPAEVGPQEAEQVRRAFARVGHDRALVGALRREEVIRRLSGADVFVLPSHREGQPIAIHEALASGVPVVATRVGANPEVIREGVDGLLVDPLAPDQLADALAELIGDPDRRRAMGRSARERARAYGIDRLRDTLTEVYDEAASRT